MLQRCLTAVFCIVLSFAGNAQEVTISEMRSWYAPDHVRMVFDLSTAGTHNLFTLENPERVVIDFANARLGSNNVLNSKVSEPVTGIRHGKHHGKLRVVIDLSKKVSARGFQLQPNESYGNRLVVDIYTLDNISPVVRSEHQRNDNRDVVVAIDAGHGGEDPGAIGTGGEKEKDITLRYAYELHEKLNSQPGIQAILIRKGDYYISLQKRTRIAHQHNADLFVSIHANSFVKDKRVSGFMLFALSEQGATSEIAKWLAQSENRSDAIGGSEALPLEGKSDDVRKILIDLSMTSSLNHSIFAGNAILKNIGDSAFQLHSQTVEQADFAVLKAQNIPSLLIELGFLSNREEVRKLTSTQYRIKMSQALADGIADYFQLYPPYGSSLSKKKHISSPYHTVAEGDTLFDIAEKYDLSINEIRTINKMTGNVILVGQKLRVSKAPLAEKYYVVRYGDTLSEIALQFGTSVSRLRKINQLSDSDIRSGQKLRISSTE